jgi:hypothetical protein
LIMQSENNKAGYGRAPEPCSRRKDAEALLGCDHRLNFDRLRPNSKTRRRVAAATRGYFTRLAHKKTDLEQAPDRRANHQFRFPEYPQHVRFAKGARSVGSEIAGINLTAFLGSGMLTRMDPPPSFPRRSALVDRVPPHAYFVVSAIFHYLGPSFAVLLFARIEPLGVAWLRIASAAVVFAVWRRPWRYFGSLNRGERWTVVGLGVVLAGMNCLFYLAIQQLPLGTVGAIEFLGPIGLAALGTRSLRNLLALLVAISGVYILTDVRFEGAPMGYVFAFANCACSSFTSSLATASPVAAASIGSGFPC